MKSLLLSALALFLMLPPGIVQSQPVIAPQNISMGGGGTAYLTGYEANFLNPANLMIPDRETSLGFGVGQLGSFTNPVFAPTDVGQQFEDYHTFLDASLPGSSEGLSNQEKETILQRNYPNRRRLSEHQHRFDLILGGVQWKGQDHAMSLTARIRSSTRTEVGRGWYDNDYVERGSPSTYVREMSLIQQSQFLYEFSFGYAQTFDFATGLIPRLGKLYIGIAPKFVIGGSYMNMRYNARYWYTDEMDTPNLTQKFNYSSTGNYSDATEQYMLTGNARNAVRDNFPTSFISNSNEYTQPTGYGGGFDFGLVYVLSLGDDLTLAKPENLEQIKKSLRLGFSVTDVGFISYTENSLSLAQQPETLVAVQNPTAQTSFGGYPGQHISFFDESGDPINPFQGPLRGITNEDRSNFTILLPTSLNAGMLLQVNRLKLSADLTLGLNDTAFNNTKLIGHFGIEFSPIEAIPIRVGSQLAAGYPTLWSAGTGLQMKHWELTFGAQFSKNRGANFLELNGAAIGGLKFHF